MPYLHDSRLAGRLRCLQGLREGLARGSSGSLSEWTAENTVHDDPAPECANAKWQGGIVGVMDQALKGENGFEFILENDELNGYGVVRYRSPSGTTTNYPVRRLGSGALSRQLLPKASASLPPKIHRSTSAEDDTNRHPVNPHTKGKKIGLSDREIYDQVDARVASFGGEAVERGADGNCFFRSLAGALNMPIEYHMELRRRTVEHIRNSVTHGNTAAADGYRERIEANPAYRDLNHYCEMMGTDRVYVEDIEIYAAVIALNVNIRIYGLDEDHDVFIRHPNPNWRTREVYLVRYDTSDPHYRECIFPPRGKECQGRSSDVRQH